MEVIIIDTLLKNGDFALDARGIPTAIFGADEIIQRILLALAVKKGCFLPDQSIGSLLHTLPKNLSPSELSQRAYQYAVMATNHIPNISISSAQASFSSPNTLLITLTIDINGSERHILQSFDYTI